MATVSIVACPLLSWMKSSTAMDDSCHVHSSSHLLASDQVQGTCYSESEVETDMAALQLETSMTTLELETDVAALEFETFMIALKLETSATTLGLETNAAALELGTYTTAMDLETKRDIPQEISNQGRHLIDLEW
jgi:hypothetical protein